MQGLFASILKRRALKRSAQRTARASIVLEPKYLKLPKFAREEILRLRHLVAGRRAYIPKSKRIDWGTPDSVYLPLHKEFDFTLDAAASETNAKCKRFFTEQQNALKQDWGKHRVWLNPPYGRIIAAFMKKASEAAAQGALVVLLVPARTDTKWFHRYVNGKAEVRLMEGRITFIGAKAPAPFPTMLVIFRPTV